MRGSFQIIILLVALSLVGCASTPVTPSPLAPEREEALRCALKGKWRLVRIDGEPPEYSKHTYVFDRTQGAYIQEQQSGGGFGTTLVVPGTSTFSWRLEGRNLILEGDHAATFRVEDWNDTTLTWFNYRTSDNFELSRVGAKPACEVAEIAGAPKLKYPGDCKRWKLLEACNKKNVCYHKSGGEHTNCYTSSGGFVTIIPHHVKVNGSCRKTIKAINTSCVK